MRTATMAAGRVQPWRAAVAAFTLALLGACGGGEDAAPPPVAGPAPAPAPASGPVANPAPAPAAASIAVLPTRLSLRVGADAALVALSTASVVWSSSNPAVASVDAQGRVTALAAGSAAISATAGATVATATMTIHADTAASSSALIAAALAAGSIDAEQALLYQVFSLYADARLPAALAGAPEAVPDHGLMRDVSGRLATLSLATQELLAPFLVPPIYAESWYAKRAAAQAAGRAHALAGSGGQAQRSAVGVNCEAAALPAFWKRLSTAHFNVFHLALGDPVYDAFHLKIAQTIAAVAEEVYAAETGLLNRFPLADTAEPCNGGDGAVDFYVTNLGAGPGGITQTYPGRCNKVPSFVLLDYNHPAAMRVGSGVAEARGELKASVAHELAHVLQFAMDRPGAPCEDYRWLDEATAQWAMDFVGLTVNREDGYDPVAYNRRRIGSVYGQYLLSDHMASMEKPGGKGDPKLNGYAEYIFFQYLANKYDAQTIKQVFDATASLASVEAVQSALASKGGMKAVWPDFALTLWNDSQNQVLDDFSRWDSYDYGLGAIFQRQVVEKPTYRAAAERLRTLEIDQKGQPRASFKLLENALEFPGDYYEIAPRSVFYEHLKFSDATVHSVYFSNPIAAFQNKEFMKVQVKKKIGGQWQATEDWTGEPFKQFCLDKKDERLEELLIVVSNSEVDRGAERAFQIPKNFPMRLATSNVGCWQWRGTSTTTVNDSFFNLNSTTTGTVTLAVTAVLPGRLIFEPHAGRIQASAIQVFGCTTTSTAPDKTIVPGAAAGANGSVDFNLDLDLGFSDLGGDPPDRKTIALQGFSTMSTTTTMVCPGALTTSSTGDQSWEWLKVNDPSQYSVSADGQAIEGNFTSVLGTTTVKSVWKFTAMRE